MIVLRVLYCYLIVLRVLYYYIMAGGGLVNEDFLPHLASSMAAINIVWKMCKVLAQRPLILILCMFYVFVYRDYYVSI